jgi:hypothetical protein
MDPVIAAAIISGVFGIIVVLMQREMLRRTKTNHGKKLGQHVETIGDDIGLLKLAAAQTAADLATYKLEQARDRAEDKAQIERYVAEDALAHAQLRELVTQQSAEIKLRQADGTK